MALNPHHESGGDSPAYIHTTTTTTTVHHPFSNGIVNGNGLEQGNGNGNHNGNAAENGTARTISPQSDEQLHQEKLLNEKRERDHPSNRDPERGANGKFASKYGNSDRTVGGRIGPVLGHLSSYDFGSEDSGEDMLGKQLEMEAGDAIQYRTCSWQKVGAFFLGSREMDLGFAVEHEWWATPR